MSSPCRNIARTAGMSRGQAVVDRAAKTLAGMPLEEQDKKRLIYGALPSPLLIVLLPVGLLGLCERRVGAVARPCRFLFCFMRIIRSFRRIMRSRSRRR